MFWLEGEIACSGRMGWVVFRWWFGVWEGVVGGQTTRAEARKHCYESFEFQHDKESLS